MLKDDREDIFTEGLDKIYLSFFASSIRVGVIGGGRAAAIKVRTLSRKNIYTEVLAKEFSEELLSIENSNLNLTKTEYTKEFLRDKHMIIIAVNDYNLEQRIKIDCEEEYKIYINCSNFKDGMGAIPVQRELNNISFGLSTKLGNPRGALLAADTAAESLKDIDEFIGLTGRMRENIKAIKGKEQIMKFVVSDDFMFFWQKGKEKLVLNMFLKKDEVERVYDFEVNKWK